MSTALDALNQTSADWAALMAAVVWQSTLLALVVAVIAYGLRASSPALRYWLWQILAIKLLVMPFWIVSLPLPWPAAPTIAAMATTNSQVGPSIALPDDLPHVERPSRSAAPAREPSGTVPILRSPRSRAPWVTPGVTLGRGLSPSPRRFSDRLIELNQVRWTAWLFMAWAVVVAAQLGRLFVQRHRLSRILRDAVPAEHELAAMVAQVAGGLDLRRPPAVLLTSLAGSPFVCGLLRPKLVLASALVATLDEGDMRQILAHELAHLKRRDLAWGWVLEMARVVYFFHPVAHWACYRAHLERELACDQLAMASSGRGPAQYAETLVRVVSSLSCPSVFRASAVAGLDGNRPLEGAPTKPRGQEP